MMQLNHYLSNKMVVEKKEALLQILKVFLTILKRFQISKMRQIPSIFIFPI